jgi:hypothetical protein
MLFLSRAAVKGAHLDSLEVRRLLTVLREDAELRRALVKRLGTLVQAALQAIVDEGLFQDLFDGLVDRHGLLRRWLLGSDLRRLRGSLFVRHLGCE